MFFKPQIASGSGSTFTNRGETETNDFETGDLTKDGNYNDMDLSSIVGAGVRLVQLHIELQNTTAEKYMTLRTNGYTATKSRYIYYTKDVNQTESIDVFIYTDSAGKIEYRFENIAWGIASFVVRGWFV